MERNVLPSSLPPRPPRQSLQGLDWLNFFLAAVLSGFGPFVAVYLAGQQWNEKEIGLVLTASGIAGLLSQLPGGELLDAIRSKRLVVAVAVTMVALGALMFAIRPSFTLVFTAATLQGATGGFLGPAIGAISLGLVGHSALAKRLGRNQRFASIGAFSAAGLMGLVGYSLSNRAIFLATTVLALPTLLALGSIRAADIQFGRSCGAPPQYDSSTSPPRITRIDLCKRYRLLIFAGCIVLFQVANASILPLIGEALAQSEGRRSSLVMSALVVVPQIVVALASPWVGDRADTWGRRPLLLIGFGALPLRAALMTLINNPVLLVGVQVLDGVSGAVLGVLTALVIADLTKGTSRYNLAQGMVGTFSGFGASLSTTLSGFVVASFGRAAGFLGMGAVALVAVAVLWALMPETKPVSAG